MSKSEKDRSCVLYFVAETSTSKSHSYSSGSTFIPNSCVFPLNSIHRILLCLHHRNMHMLIHSSRWWILKHSVKYSQQPSITWSREYTKTAPSKLSPTRSWPIRLHRQFSLPFWWNTCWKEWKRWVLTLKEVTYTYGCSNWYLVV